MGGTLADTPVRYDAIDSRKKGEAGRSREHTPVQRAPTSAASVMSGDGRISTPEQLESYLPAVERTLPSEILDRIDELVAPGVTINPGDNSYGAHELLPHARRR